MLYAGRYTIIHNGELYNYLELKQQLQQKGHSFNTSSDTEVIAAAYSEWGNSCLQKFDGMFAFAIYDRRRRRIMLARDRFGVKPLYYASVQGQRVFASEMKAILALKGFSPSINRQACYDYLGLGYVPEPETAFARNREGPQPNAFRRFDHA